jgi:hypothetical protein
MTESQPIRAAALHPSSAGRDAFHGGHMPTGTMFMHERIGSLFIDADDGKYYQPKPEVALSPGTRVTFDVLNVPGAPPGFYFASNVKAAAAPTQALSGTMVIHPSMGSLFINGEDGKYYRPRPDVSLTAGTRVSFHVLQLADAPPGFLFAGNVQALPAATATVVAATNATSPTQSAVNPPAPKTAMGAWGKPLPASITTPSIDSATQETAVVNQPAPVGPALPVPNVVTPRTLSNRQTLEDFQLIARKVGEINWGQNAGWGPSMTVTTKLRWEGEGIELYMRVLEEYQDKRIPGTNMYYYVGTMDVNFGKAGFRISAHSRPRAQIDKSKTYTVLHVEN